MGYHIGMTVTCPTGSGVIDATAEHPDGLTIFRVNDQWFDARYLNT